MVLFNYSTKELTAKIVYYGPGLCGKTTNLQYIHGNLPENVKGKMLSLATKTDRTLFFDFLPIDLGEIRGMQTRVQLYTVPGQVFYNETRKLVLKGADGIVFVADSQQQMLKANVESFKNLEENLRGHGLELAQMPHVIQFNKRDLPKLSTIEEMNAGVNVYNAPFYESVATTGIGVQDSLKAITKLVLVHLTQKYDPKTSGAKPMARKAAPARTPVPKAAPKPTDSIPLAGGGPRQEVQVPLSSPAPAPAAAAPLPTPDPAIAPAAALDASAPQPGRSAASPSAASPMFGADEIGSLVDEVAESAAPATAQMSPTDTLRPTPVTDPALPDGMELSEDPVVAAEPPVVDELQFEVDHAVDPEAAMSAVSPAPEAPPHGVAPPAPARAESPTSMSEAPVVQAESAVALTEVASDHELFDDPGLDVARVEVGSEREIVIPVELCQKGGEVRRFTLSVKLCLAPLRD